MNLDFLAKKKTSGETVVAVHTELGPDDQFLAGYLMAADGQGIVLALISPNGAFGGMCFCASEAVCRVETTGADLLALKETAGFLPLFDCAGVTWGSLLTFARANGMVVRFVDHSGRRIAYGIPARHRAECVMVQVVGADGIQGEWRNIQRETVALMTVGSEEEQAVWEKWKKNVGGDRKQPGRTL